MVTASHLNPACTLVLLKSQVFQDAWGNSLVSLQDFKCWRKANKRFVVLQLARDWVHHQKVYLAKAEHTDQELLELLWRELDQEIPLSRKDIFYDYLEVASSLPDHSAYQFFWLKKTQLKPYLKQLKRARLKVLAIQLNDEMRLNLLPWRQHRAQKKLLNQLGQLLLLPLGLFVLLLIGDVVLQQHNQTLHQRIARYYDKNLPKAVGVQQRLSEFQTAFALINALPTSSVLNLADYNKGTWFISGTFNNSVALAPLNETLTQLKWLAQGASVDIYEQDQQYVWQLKK